MSNKSDRRFSMSIVNSNCLYKHWIHSYEEDEQGKKVYRPSNFEFPLSFGRDGFEIKKTGEIILYIPGMDDGIEERIGQFQIRDSDKIEVNTHGRHFTITVLLCETDRLVVSK